MTLTPVTQDSWAGGMWRLSEPQAAPPNTAYDIVNAYIDGGSLKRRGGSTYNGTHTPPSGVWQGIAVVDTPPFQRTLAWSSAGGMYVLTGSATKAAIAPTDKPPATTRPAAIGGMVVFPSVTFPNRVLYYGGANTYITPYTTGTVTVTENSKTVTGSGTAWLTNAEPGSVMVILGVIYLVDSVDSNTQITLRDPYPRISNSGIGYSVGQGAYSQTIPSLFATGSPPAVASVGNRTVVCKDNRAAFSPLGSPGQFTEATDYHELQSDALTLGAEAIRDTLIWFTTRGVWTISNMALDLTDDYGNTQHQTRQINKDIVLAGTTSLGGASGVVGWKGQLLVPARDDVYLMTVDGAAEPISAPIRPLYRSYIQAGYLAGAATVWNGHYLLPIVNTSGVVQDVFVCNLSEGLAWSRWDGVARSPAYSIAQQSATAPSELYGVTSTRLTTLTNVLNPPSASTTDADGTAHVMSVTTRDYIGTRQQDNLWRYARLRYELAGSATLSAEKATGQPGASFTALTGSAPTDDGSDPYEWSVDERAQNVRLRIQSSGAASDLTFRNLEVFVRPTGKR